MSSQLLISKRRYPVPHEDTVQGPFDMMVKMSTGENSHPGLLMCSSNEWIRRCDNGLHKPSIPSSCCTRRFLPSPKSRKQLSTNIEAVTNVDGLVGGWIKASSGICRPGQGQQPGFW